MTDNQIISKLQELKKIKPRAEWVLLVKDQIFTNDANGTIVNGVVANSASHWKFIVNTFNPFQRKLSYTLAALLILFTGALSIKYFLPNNMDMAQESTGALAVKSNVTTFKVKSQSLAEAVKNNSENLSLAVKEIKDATRNLTNAIAKDPETVREVALEVRDNKTLLDNIDQEDLRETSDALYKTIDTQMIEDLQKTTLTQEQQVSFDEVKDLYSKGKYYEALEKILLISN